MAEAARDRGLDRLRGGAPAQLTTRIEPEDVLLLCTDGVTNALADPATARLLASRPTEPRARLARDQQHHGSDSGAAQAQARSGSSAS